MEQSRADAETTTARADAALDQAAGKAEHAADRLAASARPAADRATREAQRDLHKLATAAAKAEIKAGAALQHAGRRAEARDGSRSPRHQDDGSGD